MMTPLSAFVWEMFPVLQIIQFPQRLIPFLTVACVAFLAFYFDDAHDGQKRRRDVILLHGLIMLFIGMSYIVGVRWSLHHPPQIENIEWQVQRNQEYYQWKTTCFGEYLPLSTEGKWISYEHMPAFYALCQEKTRLLSGHAEITVLGWEPRHITLAVQAEEESRFSIAQLAYPGWQAHDADDSLLSYPVGLVESTGLISLTVPKGRHRIDLRLHSRFSEVNGQLLSAFALLLWIVLWGFLRKRPGK